ncbi:MAG: hypothetical protein KC410_04780 [Anaerolineales bacterium]|uniref:hypothetical protein n=1 Tax=Promineifilum sp. TaxID=2664178 RepID=UPI001D58176E|nr:hypothetical protein [Anaerolineales bacterium]MCO5179295.1 hypothetical protein [Promineifilum sp.]
MSYQETIHTLAADAEQLEHVYQAALDAGEGEAFRQAIDANRTAAPDNLLFAAWYYRLRPAAARAKASFIAWGWALPLALLNGLFLWFLSDDQRFAIEIAAARPNGAATNFLPLVILLAAPLSAVFVSIYLTAAGRKRWGTAALISVALAAAGAYVVWAYPRTGTRPFQEQYLTLATIHLALLAWAGVGALLLRDQREPAQRFAFLIKSLEVFVMGGLFVIAGGIFTGITVGLFDALDVTLPAVVQRLFIAGGGGLIPVIATAVIYNPAAPPAGQEFEEGLSRLGALLARVLLPLTLLVLIVYLAFIPFNFREPFDNRDVLIIYNAMLFGVIALLVAATPVDLAAVSPRVGRWLRRGILAVAALALVISLYALAAIVYRTALDRLTPNRLAFIGWNLINSGLLVLLLAGQARGAWGGWAGVKRTFAAGMVAYAVWSLAVIVAVPWLFGIDQGQVSALPATVQTLIYENPDPILLKCADSPPIYLLADGRKQWIDSIATFTARGYLWRDVRFVPCDDLRAVPDGPTIPEGVGPPPQP